MKLRTLTLCAAAILLVVGVACGGTDAGSDTTAAGDSDTAPEATTATEGPGDTEATGATGEGLDCPTIEVMVPYAPGGGSDNQVRRLEPHLADALGTNLNIVYREGAAGAVAWTALHDAEPDGCTVANVVVPNILIAAAMEGSPFAADDFEYLGFTELAPNAIAVALESEFETIEQFIEEAKARPGELAMAGSGQGPLATEQFMDATETDVTFVPMEGGAAEGLQAVQGGHADAVNFSSAHVVNNSDTVRALTLSGTEPSPALEDVPTLAEVGYEGFRIVAAWGLIAPPGTPDGVVQTWNEAINSAVETAEVNDALIEGGLTPVTMTPEEADEFLADELAAFEPPSDAG